MALILNSNSYVTVAEADAYFADRLHSTNWINAIATDKEKALIQATKMIDFKHFMGYKTISSQLLKFPRTGIYYDGELLDSLSVPLSIMSAVFELAIYLLSDDYTTPNEISEFDNIKVGSLNITPTKQNNNLDLPPFVNELLKPFIRSGIGISRG